MSKYTGVQLVWTLTVLRHGAQGSVGELAEAEFRFGRREKEVVRAPVIRLPSGLVSLIESSRISEEAMESGFVVEMKRSPSGERGWRLFTMLIGHESWGPRWGNPRSAYAMSEGEGTIEFADTGCPCSFYNQLPPRIWIRVTPLTMPIIAWALTNGIYSCLDGDQRTLHDWVDLTALPPEHKAEELALPGPPDKEYRFLG